MKYFTEDFLQFLKELPANNNSEWFNTNRKRYEKEVKYPFEIFVTDLVKELQDFIPNLESQPKNYIFRINRDIRFSKDKSPYKIHVSAAIAPGGKKDFSFPGLYIQLAAEDCRIYSGLYELSALELEKVRVKIATETDRFLALINDENFKKTFNTIQGEKYKKVPKGYEETFAKTTLILNKNFYYYQILPAEMILEDNFLSNIIEKYKPALALNQFFAEALR